MLEWGQPYSPYEAAFRLHGKRSPCYFRKVNHPDPAGPWSWPCAGTQSDINGDLLHGDPVAAGRGRGAGRRIRHGRRGDRIGCRRARRLPDRHGADQFDAASRGRAPLRLAPADGGRGPADGPHLRPGADFRDGDLGDPFRGDRAYRTPGREGRREGDDLFLFRQSGDRALRGAGGGDPARLGGRQGTGPDRADHAVPPRRRDADARSADRGEAGNRERSGVSRHGLCRLRTAAAGAVRQSRAAVPGR